MAWYLWVLLGAVAVLGGSYALRILVGFAVPKKTSGAFYLRQQLRERGIDINTVPASCLDEISALSAKTARMVAECGGEFYPSFIGFLDSEVDAIERYLYGEPAAEDNKRCAEILARYGVTKGGMKV